MTKAQVTAEAPEIKAQQTVKSTIKSHVYTLTQTSHTKKKTNLTLKNVCFVCTCVLCVCRCLYDHEHVDTHYVHICMETRDRNQAFYQFLW